MANSTNGAEKLAWRSLNLSSPNAVKAHEAFVQAQKAAKTARVEFERQVAIAMFGSSKVVQTDDGAWQCQGNNAKGAAVMSTHEVVFGHRFGPSYAVRLAGTAAGRKASPKADALTI